VFAILHSPIHTSIYAERDPLALADGMDRYKAALKLGLRSVPVHVARWTYARQRKPRALYLDHDSVPATKSMIHVGHLET
jgi:hypothetical protein